MTCTYIALYTYLGLGTRLTSTLISIVMTQLRLNLKHVRLTQTDSKANDFKPVLQLNC